MRNKLKIMIISHEVMLLNREKNNLKTIYKA